VYVFSAILMIGVCWALLPKKIGVLLFLFFYAFLYNPFLTYVNARLLGISGQRVVIPFIREASYMLSGAKGIAIWLAPIPIQNYGYQVQSYRSNEIGGVSFWSLIKVDIVALPVIFILSLTFWGFIWHADAIPGDAFPAAQINWELHAKQQVLLYSSTFVAPGDDPETKSIMDSEFMKAFHPKVLGIGFIVVVGLYGALSFLGLPVMLVYGFIRGFGRLPHFMAIEVVGAFVGKFVFERRFGKKNWRKMAPIILAGYFTGVGLIGMVTVAMRLIQAAVSTAPF